MWCPRDAARIKHALSELDDLAALVEANADGHRSNTRESDRVSGGNGPGSPSVAVDTLDEMLGELVDLEHWIRQMRGYPPRPRRVGRGAHVRTIQVAWLLMQFDDVIARNDSEPFGRRILEWRGRLQGMTASAPDNPARPGRCPRCDTKGLRERDDGYVVCSKCGRWMSAAEYRNLVVDQIGGAA